MDALDRALRDRLALAAAEMTAQPYRSARAVLAPSHRTLRPLLAAAALAAVIAAAGTGLGLHSRLSGHRPAPAAKPTPGLPTPAPTSQPTPPPTPLPAPAGMAGAQAVWDSSHGQLVLLGSVDVKGAVSVPPMWTWNGTWQERHPATAPDTGGEGTLVDMPPLHGAVWIGTSYDSGGNLAELWTGTTWQSLPAPGYSSNLVPVAAAYDEQRHQAVVVAGAIIGGCGACAAPAPPQTWTWDGRTWTRRGDALTNVMGGTAAWDPDTRSVVMVSRSDTSEQAWSWTGTRWTQLGIPAAIPVGRGDLAWDATARALILYSDSGYDQGRPVTALFRNGRWQIAAAKANPGQFVALVADTTRRRALLVGLAPIPSTQTPAPWDSQSADTVLGWNGVAWVDLGASH